MPRPIAALVFILTVAAATFTASAQQLRTIPQDARRGEFSAGQLPVMQIDGKDLRLAPGARILNERNMSVTPNLVAPKSKIAYQLDGQGQVRTVWVLTAAEAKAK